VGKMRKYSLALILQVKVPLVQMTPLLGPTSEKFLSAMVPDAAVRPLKKAQAGPLSQRQATTTAAAAELAAILIPLDICYSSSYSLESSNCSAPLKAVTSALPHDGARCFRFADSRTRSQLIHAHPARAPKEGAIDVSDCLYPGAWRQRTV
ncbi:MAG: hypothetical protein ACHQDY_07455, partial [Solirubrobacterales bacterium]